MNLKERILMIAIAIIFVFFVHYGIQTFYAEPKYEQFCNNSYYANKPYIAMPEPANYSICKAAIDAVKDKELQCGKDGGMMQYEQDDRGCQIPTTCDYCNKYYNDAMQKYNKQVFIFAGILGLIAVLVGAIVISLESVGSGIMAGGVITIIYGTLRYWGDLPDVGRFLILGLVLIILVWIGYKQLNPSLQTKKNKPNKNKKK